MFYHSSQNPSLLPTPSPFPTKDHLGLQPHFCRCPLCHCGCPHAAGTVLHPDPHDARMSGSLVPAALGAVLGTGQRQRTGICSSDGGTRGAAGPCLRCLGSTEDPRQVWEGRMGSALPSPGTARGGSWDRHPSSLLSWPGCPADGHRGDHAEGAACSPSPVQARVAKQPCSPLRVWDRGTRGHGQVTPPPRMPDRRVRHTAAPLWSGGIQPQSAEPSQEPSLQLFIFTHCTTIPVFYFVCTFCIVSR